MARRLGAEVRLAVFGLIRFRGMASAPGEWLDTHRGMHGFSLKSVKMDAEMDAKMDASVATRVAAEMAASVVTRMVTKAAFHWTWFAIGSELEHRTGRQMDTNMASTHSSPASSLASKLVASVVAN